MSDELDTSIYPEVTAKDDGYDGMKFWLNVMHRRTIDDAARMNRIEDRLRNLERPWWQRLLGRSDA